MDDNLKIQATLRLRNARMIEARQRLGISQKELAEDASVPLHNVGAFESLQYKKIKGEIHEKARRVSMSLRISVEHVLPPNMEGHSIDSTIIKNFDVDPGRMIDSESVKRLMLPSPDDVMEKEDIREQICKVISHLTPRQRTVMNLRYGFDGGGEHAPIEIAKKINVTPQNVWAIEKEAIRKLRYLVKGTDLEIDFIEEEGD